MDESTRNSQPWTASAWRPGDATPTTPPYVPSRHTDPGVGPLPVAVVEDPHAHDADLVHAAAAAARRRELDRERDEARVHTANRVFRIVDIVFFIVYALLAARFVLALLAARPDVTFVRFIHALTGPLYAPFDGIVASPTFGAGHVVALPVVIAIIAYAILHAIINAVIRAVAMPPRRGALA